jgi:hypothetical protein
MTFAANAGMRSNRRRTAKFEAFYEKRLKNLKEGYKWSTIDQSTLSYWPAGKVLNRNEANAVEWGWIREIRVNVPLLVLWKELYIE